MNASVSRAVEGEVTATPDSSDPSSRGVLVAPIVFIILISLLTSCTLLWVSGRVLNENAEAAAVHLADSLISVRGQALRDLANDLSSDSGAVARLTANPDLEATAQALGRSLVERHGVATGAVIDAKNKTVLAYQNGFLVPFDAYNELPEGIRSLVAMVRRSGENTERATWSMVRIGGQISFAAVSQITPSVGSRAPIVGREPVLILLQPMAKRFLARAEENFSLTNLRHVFEAPPADHSKVALTGVNRAPLGFLAWQSLKPGDVVLWWLMPPLSCALIAVAFLLYQFFRSTDLVLERQAYLLTSLRRERDLRTLKTRFVSMVSHELRTPLATIRSAADLLDRYDDKMSPEDKKHETQVIRESVDRLTSIIENVLVMGRSDPGGAAKTRHVRLELGSFCEEIWKEVSEPLGDSHRLVLSGTAVNRTVTTDDTLLASVISNLMQNAIKYSPGRESVICEINSYAHNCIIRIQDFGPGISPEDKERVFEAFYRSGSISNTTSGTGLGLSVAKAAAERLGGGLTLVSEPGKGTTFQLELPNLLRNRTLRRRKEET